jgi:DNA-binding response OmpR family regulator
MQHILVVEDDKAIAAFVQAALAREGFVVSAASSGEQALDHIRTTPPDLVVLDLMLPGVGGLDVCRRIRQREQYLPIVILSARSKDVEKIVGLEVGADDYVTKPFNGRELVARVRAVLRLAGQDVSPGQGQIVRVADLSIDRTRHHVTVGGQVVDLTPKEFELLSVMAAEPGRVFGREMLLERIWGYDYDGESRTVDVHIQRLRAKIEPDPAHPTHILTVHGLGYKFAAEERV